MLPKTVLVPTDFSDHAERATDYACELARKLGARVILLHAYALPSVGFPESIGFGAELAGRVVTVAEEALRAAKERRQASGVEIVTVAMEGDPRDLILGTIDEHHADLVCMGTHGRRGLARAMLGSVAEEIVRHAPCGVLTLRASASP